MKVKVHVTLKNEVLDPQGKAIENALKRLGFDKVEGVRIGKYIEFNIDENSPEKAHAQSDDMCKKLLANTIIENYQIQVKKLRSS